MLLPTKEGPFVRAIRESATLSLLFSLSPKKVLWARSALAHSGHVLLENNGPWKRDKKKLQASIRFPVLYRDLYHSPMESCLFAPE